MCVQGGSSGKLAIVEGSKYYKHLGSSVSAQYYVNPKGVAVQDACLWGSDQTANGLATGNWASVNIGLGQNEEGATFISLLSTEQNHPNKVVSLGFNIALEGDFGGSSCSYQMVNGVGQFCSQDGCQTQGQYVAGTGPVPGCTVSYSCCETLFRTASDSFRSNSSRAQHRIPSALELIPHPSLSANTARACAPRYLRLPFRDLCRTWNNQ